MPYIHACVSKFHVRKSIAMYARYHLYNIMATQALIIIALSAA